MHRARGGISGSEAVGGWALIALLLVALSAGGAFGQYRPVAPDTSTLKTMEGANAQAAFWTTAAVLAALVGAAVAFHRPLLSFLGLLVRDFAEMRSALADLRKAAADPATQGQPEASADGASIAPRSTTPPPQAARPCSHG